MAWAILCFLLYGEARGFPEDQIAFHMRQLRRLIAVLTMGTTSNQVLHAGG